MRRLWVSQQRSLTSVLPLHRLSFFLIPRSTAYFLSLGLSEEKASVLHKKYYSEYGLAIRGLVKHHEIGELDLFFTFLSSTSSSEPLSDSSPPLFPDALDYDRVCDASLPLEEILSYNPELRKLLQDIDPSKARILGSSLLPSSFLWRVS